jgi:hypothetical protein
MKNQDRGGLSTPIFFTKSIKGLEFILSKVEGLQSQTQKTPQNEQKSIRNSAHKWKFNHFRVINSIKQYY